MKACYTILHLLLIQIAVLAQPAIQWQKTFGGNDFDEPACIKQTTDGGYIITGSTTSTNGDVTGNHGDDDFWVIKLNASGSIQWKKVYGGDDTDQPSSIQQTTDGGYILAGFTSSNNGDASDNHGDQDAWLIKLSNDGTIEWQKTYGGSNREEARSIQQTVDGGYIFAGYASSNDGDVSNIYGDRDFWVVKLNNSGVIEWEKTFGGSFQDNANAIKQTLDGGFIVVGETASNDGDIVYNNGNIDYWIIKLSETGVIEWQKTLGGNGADMAFDVHQSSDEGFVIAGQSGSHNTGNVTDHKGSFDIWIVKTNRFGELQWQKALGGSDPDRCRSMVETNNGMYVLSGYTQSTNGDVLDNDGGIDFWIIKISTTGEIVWQKTMGGTKAEAGNYIEQTSDNGYILTGYTWSTDGDLTGSTNHGQNDFWVVKLAPETVGTNETPQPIASQLDVFPNPAQQAVTLKTGAEASELAVVLTDVLGRRLLEKIIPNGGAMQIAWLPDGVYWVQATDEDGHVYSTKMVKKE